VKFWLWTRLTHRYHPAFMAEHDHEPTRRRGPRRRDVCGSISAADLKHLLDQHIPMSAIARIAGVTRQRVHQCAVSFGFHTPTPPRPRPPPPPPLMARHRIARTAAMQQRDDFASQMGPVQRGWMRNEDLQTLASRMGLGIPALARLMARARRQLGPAWFPQRHAPVDMIDSLCLVHGVI
jgi:hypothetical protein